ncbi:thioredoxin family protein [Aridibaculum aurantiacum]|uniref:thioredoxin family protein n=1 Tax=Aridibaculum aurantiacum TaxID=2810307 RepID=UPI001A973FC6|nr:thioredoxin family protein [Aridibaculum aurantiacum]
MRRVLAAVAIVSLLSACATQRQAKSNYEVIPDDEGKILRGPISRAILQNDTTYKWLAENMKYGTADASAVEAFRNNANNFSMVVFGGTWCEDTRNLLPVFYRLVEKSGYPDNKITLIGVDREKTAPQDLHKKYNVTLVPTFIVMRDGKEIGRVVEYGKEGAIDKELGQIVATGTAK